MTSSIGIVLIKLLIGLVTVFINILVGLFLKLLVTAFIFLPKEVTLQVKIKDTLAVLHDNVFTLKVGVVAEDKAKNLIFQYFDSNPGSHTDARTITAVLLWHCTYICGEYRSLNLITSALNADRAWVHRKRRGILSHCGIELFHPSNQTSPS
ncbi:MAG: hypothetical protein ACFFBD_19540 [Candidatus Hodarchaeota archaeon]